jgi:hypothetical protein
MLVGVGTKPVDYYYLLLFSVTLQPRLWPPVVLQPRLWLPRSRGFMITHNEATQSVVLLWTSDRLVAERSI